MCQSISLLSVYLLCVYLFVGVILNQSASKIHAIFLKPAAHLTHCCMWHDCTFSQRNKARRDTRGGGSKGVGKKLKRGGRQHRGVFIK